MNRDFRAWVKDLTGKEPEELKELAASGDARQAAIYRSMLQRMERRFTELAECRGLSYREWIEKRTGHNLQELNRIVTATSSRREVRMFWDSLVDTYVLETENPFYPDAESIHLMNIQWG
jgi:hypothetical protein